MYVAVIYIRVGPRIGVFEYSICTTPTLNRVLDLRNTYYISY